MTTLVLHLESATQYERIDDVASFVAEDASGSFGILPGHAPMSTVLEFGLARYRVAGAAWWYVAAPGAVIRHDGRALHFSTRRYVRDASLERVRAALQEQLRAEEEALHAVTQSLRRLEEEMFKRLWKLGRGGEAIA
jgi:F-type H+-transporting ATPase subunit epsilon